MRATSHGVGDRTTERDERRSARGRSVVRSRPRFGRSKRNRRVARRRKAPAPSFARFRPRLTRPRTHQLVVRSIAPRARLGHRRALRPLQTRVDSRFVDSARRYPQLDLRTWCGVRVDVDVRTYVRMCAEQNKKDGSRVFSSAFTFGARVGGCLVRETNSLFVDHEVAEPHASNDVEKSWRHDDRDVGRALPACCCSLGPLRRHRFLNKSSNTQ